MLRLKLAKGLRSGAVEPNPVARFGTTTPCNSKMFTSKAVNDGKTTLNETRGVPPLLDRGSSALPARSDSFGQASATSPELLLRTHMARRPNRCPQQLRHILARLKILFRPILIALIALFARQPTASSLRPARPNRADIPKPRAPHGTQSVRAEIIGLCAYGAIPEIPGTALHHYPVPYCQPCAASGFC